MWVDDEGEGGGQELAQRLVACSADVGAGHEVGDLALIAMGVPDAPPAPMWSLQGLAPVSWSRWAARMIERRSEEVQLAPDAAELWAAKLRHRQPRAAHLLLGKAAAAALRRGDSANPRG